MLDDADSNWIALAMFVNQKTGSTYAEIMQMDAGEFFAICESVNK